METYFNEIRFNEKNSLKIYQTSIEKPPDHNNSDGLKYDYAFLTIGDHPYIQMNLRGLLNRSIVDKFRDEVEELLKKDPSTTNVLYPFSVPVKFLFPYSLTADIHIKVGDIVISATGYTNVRSIITISDQLNSFTLKNQGISFIPPDVFLTILESTMDATQHIKLSGQIELNKRYSLGFHKSQIKMLLRKLRAHAINQGVSSFWDHTGNFPALGLSILVRSDESIGIKSQRELLDIMRRESEHYRFSA